MKEEDKRKTMVWKRNEKLVFFLSFLKTIQPYTRSNFVKYIDWLEQTTFWGPILNSFYGVKYFSKCIFQRGDFQRVFSQVATSQMC